MFTLSRSLRLYITALQILGSEYSLRFLAAIFSFAKISLAFLFLFIPPSLPPPPPVFSNWPKALTNPYSCKPRIFLQSQRSVGMFGQRLQSENHLITFINIVHMFKKVLKRMGGMAPQLKVLILHRGPHTWQYPCRGGRLTTLCNSSSKRPDVLFWAPLAPL